MLYRANRRRIADGRAPAEFARAQMDRVGAYLTDEVFLYRVVDLRVTDAGGMVELEDCYWLDVVSVPLSDLRARRLRVVAAA